jgi:hypothetical protein
VCTKNYLSINLDITKFTLKDLIVRVLRDKSELGINGDIEIRQEERHLYDDIDFDENLDKSLAELSILNGMTLTITSDNEQDPSQQLSVVFFIAHVNDMEGFEVFGDKNLIFRPVPQVSQESPASPVAKRAKLEQVVTVSDDLIVLLED